MFQCERNMWIIVFSYSYIQYNVINKSKQNKNRQKIKKKTEKRMLLESRHACMFHHVRGDLITSKHL